VRRGFVISGGCSDDGFEYFRCWLIAQGKAVFEAALKDPDSLSELDIEDDPEEEELLYLAPEIYEEKTGEEMPSTGSPDPSEPTGDAWDEDSVEELFPKLAAKYGDG